MPAKNVIKLRTGSTVPSAASFATSEPAWDSTNALLYVKSGAGAMVPIGVIPYATTANFPATGVSPTLYIATDTGRLYRWTGTAYAEVGSVSTGNALPARSVVSLGTAGTTLTVTPPADAYDGVVTVNVQSDVAITIVSPAAFAGFSLIVKQDATGGRIVTFAGSITWADGFQPKAVINANTFVAYRFVWNGSTYHAWIEGQPQDTESIYKIF
jgi:hypothetical protein